MSYDDTYFFIKVKKTTIFDLDGLDESMNLFFLHLHKRIAIKMMENQNVYYRPEWTCGRYDTKHDIAIFYNLIEGVSYFFEDFSAKVIGQILSAGRNGKITLENVARSTGILVECLRPFFDQLSDLHLLSHDYLTADYISDYRNAVSKNRCHQSQTTVKSTKEKLPIAVGSAEMDYMDKAGGIFSVMFELTYNCSEKCIHCYNIGATRNDGEESHRGAFDELTLADYKRIIDQLYEQGLVRVTLTGGDPFSKPFVWDIIDYLYKKEIAFDVYTNGQRLVNNVDRLANYYPRVVGVSIYSGLENVHDGITRIKGSWKRSTSVIKRLSELAVCTTIKCCVMQPNLKSYYMVADMAKKYGAEMQFEVNVTDSVDGDKCVSRYLRLKPEQLEIVLRDDNVPLYVGKEAPNYGGQPRIMTKNACGAGCNTFCITPDGDFIPCCAFHLNFGNLRKQCVADIFNNSSQLKWWNSLTLEQYEECGKHAYCDYCNLCAGINYSEKKTPLKPGENNCYMAKNRFALANKLRNGQDPLNGNSLVDVLSAMPDFHHKKFQREFNDNKTII